MAAIRKGAHRATYRAWEAMKHRCDNPSGKDVKNYLERGIRYTQVWALYDNFLADMGECPEGLQLDRKDNDLGYSKENCRWATKSVNQRNKREEELRALELKLQRMGYDLDQLDLDNPYTQFGEDIE